MASARLRRREKQYEELARENARLHRDVEGLETAFFLHRQVLQEEENSVRGMIRKEVGGSRWEHGGTGKLTTYKSRKDLKNQTERKPADTLSSVSVRNGNDAAYEKGQTEIPALYDTDSQPQIVNGGNRKLTDLKTKVLKKASSKVIKRDKWNSPNRQTECNTENITNKVTNDHLRDRISQRDTKAKSKVKPKEKVKPGTFVLDKNETRSLLNDTEKHCVGHNLQNGGDRIGNRKSGTRLSRKDLCSNKPETYTTLLTDDIETEAKDANAVNDDNVGLVNLAVMEKNATDITSSKGIANEATELYIDPNNAQVRIRALASDSLSHFSETENTKVLIQGKTNTEAETPQSFKFSIVEGGKKSPAESEIRDVFGVLDFETKSALPSSLKKSPASLSPFALTKDCDTEVEFWLRGLGLADVEHYVTIFAENEIDLLDLEFMSAAQLHDMGVSDTEALNILLNGIRELRNLPPDKATKHEHGAVRKGLQATSIAWEDNSVDKLAKKSAELKNLGKTIAKTEHSESHKNKTFTKGTNEMLKSSRKVCAETSSYRSDSAMSNKSDYSLDTSRASSRKEGSFSKSAQSRASNRKQKSESVNADARASARPTSAKAGKLHTDSKSQLQKKTASVPIKKQKTQDQTADGKSRLLALETRPTRSVLLKRSASLTRDSGRGQTRKTRVQEEPENRRPSVRGRSRSADAVKRKALEGVQAAAKKHEERQMKDRENEETKNKIQERKKVERDEMAARHLQREKNKPPMMTGTVETKEKHSPPSPVNSPDLESLVTVNILSQKDNQETVGKPSNAEEDKSKTRVVTPAASARKSLRRIELVKKTPGKTAAKSDDRHVQSDYEVPVLSTYKLETKPREGVASEPESGYRTDTSTTYSQVEEKVAEIQHKQGVPKMQREWQTVKTQTRLLRSSLIWVAGIKRVLRKGSRIKRLKSRATSGDMVTLTLVKDLQNELQHFEKLLTEKEKTIKLKNPETGPRKYKDLVEQSHSTTETPVATNTDRASTAPKVQMPTSALQNQSNTLPRKPSTSLAMPSPTVTPLQEAVIEDLLIEDTVVKGGDDLIEIKDKAAMSMSKKELLDEMRKEKHQHHRQIRQLQSELKRMRETDAASSMELNHNDIVYREEEVVGEGTFSKVFRGTYQGAEVAIKRLIVPLAAQDRNYFSAEVSLLRELRHPRVVLLIGVCTSDKLPLMVLEFMSGGSLFNHLHNAQSEPLDHAEYYQVARDIALGMNYLHSHKPEVLHLDLKSMNVLLCQSFRAKIADFGFSKLRHDATAKLPQKGKSRPPRASPAWMAPEMIDKGEVSCKADVYSFAIILWEMLTRSLPYENATVFHVLEMVRKNKRPEIPSSCPEGLRLLISRSWDQNPARRLQFKDIVSSLENLAFPPAWRELFKKAGVPEEALHNIESTRTLINLVRTTLDSSSFSSFLISNPKDSKLSPEEPTSLSSEETTASTCIPTNATVKPTDDWENNTISDISEISTERNSEFSLGTLRDSSDESSSDSMGETITENYGDESSGLSSDEDSIILPVSSRKHIKPHKKINVFVPSLELSMKSPVVEPSAEEKSKFDWVSISLEDRSSREDETNVTHSTDKQIAELSLSGRSDRIVAAVSPVTNTSSRPNEKKSWQERAKEMDEYLMRESINNRRPTSPIRKRLSLTKKLAERTARSLDTENNAKSEDFRTKVNEDLNDSRMAFTDRTSGNVLDNSVDLTSLNKKLAKLNSKFFDTFDEMSSNVSQNCSGQFRRLADSSADSLNHSTSDGQFKVSLKEGSDLVGNRSTMKVDLSPDKSYDSFYGLPVNSQQVNDNAFSKSEITLPRTGSFTRSKDVLDLLTSQIKHTTKTLEEMEQESDTIRQQRNAVHSTENNDLDRAKNLEASKIFAKNICDDDKLKNRVEAKSNIDTHEKVNPIKCRSVADNYKSRNTFAANSDCELDNEAKEILRQKHLDDYRNFLKSEILHDSGGSIENIRSIGNQDAGDTVPKSDSSDNLDHTVKGLVEKREVEHSVINITSEAHMSDNEIVEDSFDTKEQEQCNETNSQGRDFESQFNDVARDAEEKKESIRVVLNPAAVVNRKPVITPRRSKVKESLTVTSSKDSKSVEKIQTLTDDVQSDVHTSKNVSVTCFSTDEAVRKLQALEDFAETESNEPSRPVELESTECERPLNDVTKMEHCAKSKAKSADIKSTITENPGQLLDENKFLNKPEKAAVLPKKDRQRKLPEKPKKPVEKMNQSGSKGKVMSNSEQANKGLTDTENKREAAANVPKAVKVELDEKPRKTIRVKLKKDPLVPAVSGGAPSSVPPAPPPPPLSSMSVSSVTFSKSAQVPKPAASMADELKLRVASWQSRSFQRNLVKSKHEPVVHKHVSQSKGQPVMSKKFLDSVAEDRSANLEDSLEGFQDADDETVLYRHTILIPKLSDGLPDFAVQSVELRDQKDHLRSISKPHPDQLDDLSHVSKEQLSSIAELLRKAVMERRLALGEDSASVDQSVDSVSWSLETTPRP